MISDFQSQEQEDSIADINAFELEDINNHIGQLEGQELAQKRASNVYDLLNIQHEEHPLHQRVNDAIKTEQSKHTSDVEFQIISNNSSELKDSAP